MFFEEKSRETIAENPPRGKNIGEKREKSSETDENGTVEKDEREGGSLHAGLARMQKSRSVEFLPGNDNAKNIVEAEANQMEENEVDKDGMEDDFFVAEFGSPEAKENEATKKRDGEDKSDETSTNKKKKRERRILSHLWVPDKYNLRSFTPPRQRRDKELPEAEKEEKARKAKDKRDDEEKEVSKGEDGEGNAVKVKMSRRKSTRDIPLSFISSFSSTPAAIPVLEEGVVVKNGGENVKSEKKVVEEEHQKEKTEKIPEEKENERGEREDSEKASTPLFASKRLFLTRVKHILDLWIFRSREILCSDPSLQAFVEENLKKLISLGSDGERYGHTLVEKLHLVVEEEKRKQDSAIDLETESIDLTLEAISSETKSKKEKEKEISGKNFLRNSSSSNIGSNIEGNAGGVLL
jgi:hypothetical protein